MAQSDQFNGRLGLIFASIGAAIGTGNIWRFPRMVGANGGGTFLIPWLIFLFAWSIPLVIAEFAMGKRSRTGTIGTFRIFAGKKFAWMGLWTAWISTAIGFYYAIVAGWTIKYFQLGITGGLTGEGVDTIATDQNGEVRVRTNPKFFRPAEVDLLIGDASLSEKELGWVPETSFEQLVAMMVDSDMKPTTWT